MNTSGTDRVRVVIAGRRAIRPILRAAVVEAGMQIAADCTDTAQLLAAVAREHPDLCLLDRELRGGGMAATAAIAFPQAGPKVVVVGGRGAAAEVRAARLAGAADCVPGDIDAAGLAAVVSALIQKEER